MIEVESIFAIPTAEIYADYEWNGRESSNLDVSDLKVSLKATGQKEPGEVCLATAEQQEKYGKKYLLNSGFRRFKACVELGITTYKAVLKPSMTEEERIISNFRENDSRKELNFYESMKPLIYFVKKGWPEQMVMEHLGKSRGWVQPRMMLARMIERGHTKIADIARRMEFTILLVRELNSIDDPTDLDKKLDELLQQLEHGVKKPRINKTDVKTKNNVATMLMERTKPMRMALVEWAFARGIPLEGWTKIMSWSNGVITDYNLLEWFDELNKDPRQSKELKEIFDDLDSYKDNTPLLYTKLAVLKETYANRTYERPVNGFPQK